MSIPLVQNNEKDSINTSIIAIKKNLERINSLLGLVDSGSDIDTSEFVKKSDIVDVVQSGNMNPVTSNAVATSNAMPVDTVTSGNMHAVTSNAVSEALSYSTTEQDTGAKWIDGKPIYRKVIDFGALPNNTTKNVNINVPNIDKMINYYGIAYSTDYTIIIPNTNSRSSNLINIFYYNVDKYIAIQTYSDRSIYTSTYITIEYTKTTD